MQVFTFRRVGIELAYIGPARFGKSLGYDPSSLRVWANQGNRQE